MELKIISDKTNKMFARREVGFEADYSGKTLTKEEVKEAVCKKLGLNPSLSIVIKVEQVFGRQHCSGLVHSYENENDMKVELAHLTSRGKAKEEKGAAPAAEKK